MNFPNLVWLTNKSDIFVIPRKWNKYQCVDSLLESLNNEDDDGGESASLKRWIHGVSEFIALIPAVQFVKRWWIFSKELYVRLNKRIRKSLSCVHCLLQVLSLCRFAHLPQVRGTQRQFLENICSEDDLRSRIFGTFVVKFLACLPLLGFSNTYKMV